MKRIFLTIATLLLVTCILSGCGVPEEEYNKVKSDLEATQIELSQLQRDFTGLETNYNELETRYDVLKAELEQSLVPPYTAISGREITWAFKDMDGNLREWTMPVDTYRSWIEMTKPGKTVLVNCNGRTYTMVDFRSYITPEVFNKVIPDFFSRCTDEQAFAHEMFNLVTQLTVYSKEIGEVPRWSVETLTEAGGDCEDLAILFASLLKAAPYPYKISLVYMDSNNPTDPQKPNHVVVWVEAGDWKLFVDCTSDQGWDYYERVVGWYFEL
jgi:hypothetical protein